MNGYWLFQLVVTQTLQVTLLAGIVLALTKFFAKDRPHLAHALWALVVLKCLMPPNVASPTSAFSWLSNGFAAVANKAPSPTEIERSLNTVPHEGLSPVIVRVSPGSYASDGFKTQHDLPSKNIIATRHNGSALVAIAIYLWIVIAALVFVVSALRLWIFMRRVKKKTLPTSPSLNALVKSVSQRIGLRRTVQIRTVDAAIGPAVVGLMWPTILLPKIIVDAKADSELEPLLAHELIHIRRGDLVWAMLQGMSVSLWWFNPFVWIAERLLTREAERSCDEETIAGLGCSPAMYARSLLDVMERKHELRAAPSLPGVRPVDITAKRLERIMRLGHGCYRQRPWWVVVVWLIGCAIALPGAAWVAAQEKPKQEPSVFKEAGFGSVTNPQPIRLPRAAVLGPVVAETQIEVKSFQVADVVDRLCKEHNLVKSEAEKELMRILQPHVPVNQRDFEDPITSELENAEIAGHSAATDETSQFTELSLEECIKFALENTRKRFFSATIEIVGEQLHARATVHELKKIERSLEHIRKSGFKRVSTEIEFYEIARPLIFEEGATQTGLLAFRSGGDVTSDLGLKGTLTNSTDMAAFEKSEIAKFKQWLDHDSNKEDVIHVSSPRLTAFSGQFATVQVGQTCDFTLSYKAVKAADGKTDYQPVIQNLQTGIECDTRAALVEPTNEGGIQQIELNINCRQTELKHINRSTQKFPNSDKEFKIELPTVSHRSFESGCRLNFDQTLIVVQTLEEKTLITLVHCQPIEETPLTTPNADVSVSDWLQPDLGLRVAIPAMGPIPNAYDFTPRSQKMDGERTQIFSFFMGFTR